MLYSRKDEVQAVCEALKYARSVAMKQGSAAYLSVEAGDYEVIESGFSTGRELCAVDADGNITWVNIPDSFRNIDQFQEWYRRVRGGRH